MKKLEKKENTANTTAPKVVQVATGAAHVLALLEDGTIMAWGSNNKGRLGDGTTEERHTPVTV